VSRYQKGKTSLDFTEARDSEQWHQLGHMRLQLAPDRQPRQHPMTQFFTGRMPFLLPNQQCQSTEGINRWILMIFGRSYTEDVSQKVINLPTDSV